MMVVVLWLIIVFVITVMPSSGGPDNTHLDKALHFIVYALTSALFLVELKKKMPQLVVPKEGLFYVNEHPGNLENMSMPHVDLCAMLILTPEEKSVTATAILRVDAPERPTHGMYDIENSMKVLVDKSHLLQRYAFRPQQLLFSKEHSRDCNDGWVPDTILLRGEWWCRTEEQLANCITAIRDVPGPYYRPTPQEFAEIVKKKTRAGFKEVEVTDGIATFFRNFRVFPEEPREAHGMTMKYSPSYKAVEVTLEAAYPDGGATQGGPKALLVHQWVQLERKLRKEGFVIHENESGLDNLLLPVLKAHYKPLTSEQDTGHLIEKIGWLGVS